jgi:hypothetical protein
MRNYSRRVKIFIAMLAIKSQAPADSTAGGTVEGTEARLSRGSDGVHWGGAGEKFVVRWFGNSAVVYVHCL